MDGKRSANGQHADEPDQKKLKVDGTGKPALDLVSLTVAIQRIFVSLQVVPSHSSIGAHIAAAVVYPLTGSPAKNEAAVVGKAEGSP